MCVLGVKGLGAHVVMGVTCCVFMVCIGGCMAGGVGEGLP